ncbi:MAG: polyprenyl synthetase family protein [Candidatus Marinimicrobia bacterium]|nr:polyprenyl synthetase family protein [Candidatus Neomarinimicrobiota bacterium]MBL7022668.1 polyprenyl synthetase family protein [Candidatus Neomarinimicrobiota bacterium]MBL7109938.1 polyprenyl synthetase family protein [Candidatus Neomarinimicrobiota bacterium]
MMKDIKALLEKSAIPIKDDIQKFSKYFDESLSSDVKLINTVIKYISRQKGKQLRPRLALLSARMCGEANELTYRASALIEMIHTATLIHDDVVDSADTRRGWPSVKRVWKNKIAILVGDYMFSKALTNMVHLKDFDALKVLSETAERLSQGEILQIEKAIKKDITEDIYFKMVSDKTASLFAASCEVGAITVTKDEKLRSALRSFGEKLGIAFQIKDDLFDIIGNVTQVGKPLGFDVKKNMLTLPLIHLFSSLSSFEQRKLKRMIKKYARKSDLDKIREVIISEGGIEYTEQKLNEITEQAKTELNIFPSSEYKSSLLEILDFNIQRNH